MMGVYKLVSRKYGSDEYLSLFRLGEYALQYRIGEPTEAPEDTDGIFCWLTLEEAQDHYKNMSHHQHDMVILWGEGEEECTPDKICRVPHSTALRQWYNKKHKGITEGVPDLILEGTVPAEDAVCYRKFTPREVIPMKGDN